MPLPVYFTSSLTAEWKLFHIYITALALRVGNRQPESSVMFCIPSPLHFTQLLSPDNSTDNFLLSTHFHCYFLSLGFHHFITQTDNKRLSWPCSLLSLFHQKYNRLIFLKHSSDHFAVKQHVKTTKWVSHCSKNKIWAEYCFLNCIHHFPLLTPNCNCEKKLEFFFNLSEINHDFKKERKVKNGKKKDYYLWVGTCSLTTCKCSKI